MYKNKCLDFLSFKVDDSIRSIHTVQDLEEGGGIDPGHKFQTHKAFYRKSGTDIML